MNATSQEPRTGALEEYARLKLELAAIARAILHVAERRKHDQAIRDTRRLLARLAEDRFNLAVLGQFSRGKSSLMNAILGSAKLPTGVLPLTSVITTVAYGETERVLLQREGWTFPQEIPLERLAEFVTQQANPANEKRVILAEVQFPNELLRLGIHFIDTPGIASAIAANTSATRAFLPEVDAAIVVTSFESPMTETELNFLREVREEVRRVFLVVNKLDLVSRDDCAAALDSIRSLIRGSVPGEQIEVFAISAREALNAKRQGSPEALARSGLPELETALTNFLRHEKTRELLLRGVDRAADIAHQQELATRISQRALSPMEGDRFRGRLAERVSDLTADRDSLTARMRAKLPSEFACRCMQQTALWTSGDEDRLISDLRTMFASTEVERGGKRFEELLANVCEGRFAEWRDQNRGQIDNLFRELAGEYSAAVDALMPKIARTPAELLGGSPPDESTAAIETASLTFRGFQLRLDTFPEPWWFELLPNGRFRLLIVNRWLKRIPELVRLHLSAASESLQLAANDWIDRVDRELTNHIEGVREHVTRLLHEPPRAQELAEVESILERLSALARSVPEPAAEELPRERSTALAETSGKRAGATCQCPVCLRIERALFDFMAHRQYELSIDESEQQRHALRSGFCPLHTWQFEAVASPQGICAGYPPLLTHLAKELRALAENGASASSLTDGVRSLLPGSESCAACRVAAATEDAAAQEIAALAGRDETIAAGLCLNHLCAILEAELDPSTAKRLIVDQSLALEAIAEDMQNYVLKQDATRHHLWTNAERQAALFGLMRLVGRRNTVAPWKAE